MTTKDFKDNHNLHAIILGLTIGLISKNPIAGAAVGAAAYMYMEKYGHSAPK